MVRRNGWGVGCWELQDNASQVRQNFEPLEGKKFDALCPDCDHMLSNVSVGVIDAGQFYEKVSINRFEKALECLIEISVESFQFECVLVPLNHRLDFVFMKSRPGFIPNGWVLVDCGQKASLVRI